MSLIESKIGLITILNDECIRPKGNDESFVYKALAIHKADKNLVNDRFYRRNEFAIQHFAGKVKYNAEGFVINNMDRLPTGLLDCASSSSNDIIRTAFQRLSDELAGRKKGQGRLRKRGNATILTKFNSQLADLMRNIKGARVRYIRCIKPNEKRLPLLVDNVATMRQLASAGLVTAIVIRYDIFGSCSVLYYNFHPIHHPH